MADDESPEDVPHDVRAVLTQLFAEGREALQEGDEATAMDTVTTAESVITNKLPEGDLRSRLLHGCDRVRATLDSTEADAAVAYLESMERRVAEGE